MKTAKVHLAGFVCYILVTMLFPAQKTSAQNTNCALIINCPSNIVVTSCFNVQEFYTPTASNICCGVNSTVTCSPPSGSIFTVGTTTTVTCTATDCAQNTNFCSFTVTVLQGTNCATNYLQVQCPSNIVVTSCTNVQEFYAPIVTDLNCTNWTVVCTPPSGSYFAPNTTNLVDCYVTDYCGESNSCSFTVTVLLGPNCSTNCIDLTCPSNIVVTTCSNCVPVFYAATATNSCCFSNVVLNYNPPSGTCFPLGISTVQVTAYDPDCASTPPVTCSFTVSVLQDTNCCTNQCCGPGLGAQTIQWLQFPTNGTALSDPSGTNPQGSWIVTNLPCYGNVLVTQNFPDLIYWFLDPYTVGAPNSYGLFNFTQGGYGPYNWGTGSWLDLYASNNDNYTVTFYFLDGPPSYCNLVLGIDGLAETTVATVSQPVTFRTEYDLNSPLSDGTASAYTTLNGIYGPSVAGTTGTTVGSAFLLDSYGDNRNTGWAVLQPTNNLPTTNLAAGSVQGYAGPLANLPYLSLNVTQQAGDGIGFTVGYICCTPCPTNCLQVQCPTDKTVQCGSNWAFDPPTATSCCTNEYYNGTTTPTNVLITPVSTVTNGSCPQPITITQTWSITDLCGDSNMCSQTVTVVGCCTNPCSGPGLGLQSIQWLQLPTNTTRLLPNPSGANTTGTWIVTNLPGYGDVLVTQEAPTNVIALCTNSDFGRVHAGSSFDNVPSSSGYFYFTETNYGPYTWGVLPGSVELAYEFPYTGTGGFPSYQVSFYFLNGQPNPGTLVLAMIGLAQYTTNTVSQPVTFRTEYDLLQDPVNYPQGPSADTVLNGIYGLSMVPGVTGTIVSSAYTSNGGDDYNTGYSIFQPATNLLTAVLPSGSGHDVNFNPYPSLGTNPCPYLTITVDNQERGDIFSLAVGYLCCTNCPTNCLEIQGSTNKTVQCGSTWAFDPPIATSCCTNLFGSGSTAPPTNVLITVISTVTNGACPEPMQITQTWSIIDGCGDSNTWSQTVTVVGCCTNCLQVNCPTNKTVQCSNLWTFDVPTATTCCTNQIDSENGVTNVLIIPVSTVTNGVCPQVAITQNWLIVDACGNSMTCSQTVTVVGCCTNCFQVNCSTNKTVFFDSGWTFDPPVASTCCTNLIGSTGTLTNLLITPIGIVTNGTCPNFDVTETWLITDGCGNSTTCTQTVTVLCCVPPPTNMVLWLPFDNTNGPTSPNLASFANYGTKINNPAVVLGAYVDNSLGFNGGNQYVTVPDYPGIDIGTGNLTIDAWVLRSPNDGNSPPSVITDKRDVNTGVGYSLSLSYGELILTLSGNNYRDTIGVVPADGQWHFVGVVLNQASTTPYIQFYVDTGPTATATPVPGNLDNTNSFWVAASPLGGNQPWLGDLDEIEVYDRALANSELADIFTAGAAGKCKPACTTGLSVTCPTNKTVQCGSVWTFDQPTASSCCTNEIGVSGALTNVLITSVGIVTNGVCPKVITQTWQILDGCGNSTTCTQTVTVVDTTPPFIVCPTNTIVVNVNTNCQLVIPFFHPSATDNCTQASQLIYTQTPTNGAVVNGPSQIVTVTVTDLCGNSNQCQVLVVGRYPPPVINCPGIVTVTNCVVPNVLPLVSATGCNGGYPFTFTQTPAPGSPLGPGSDIITVTVTGLGGSDTCIIAVQYGALMSFLNVLTNTGINTNGSLLANYAVDPHYTLGSVPGIVPGYTAPQAVVVTNEWSWLELTYVSEWIAPCTPAAPNYYLFGCLGGNYTYTNQFVLPVGADASTASISGRWAADNGAPEMEMNGHPTGNTIPVSYGFTHWTPFTISSNFLAYPAVNTILFVVTNEGTGPTGLRVEYTNAFSTCSNCAPPSVVWMTASMSLPLGATAVFTANVSGTLPFTYQWYHNNVPLSPGPHYPGGVTGPTLTIAPVGYADAGTYYVLVSNPCGQVKSPARTLTVTRGWVWNWGWWNFPLATNYTLATVGPNLILSGTNTLAIGTGTTLDFGLPNPAGGIANVLDVPPLPANTSIQVPLITAGTGDSSDTSYTVMLDIYEPDTSLGTPSTLFESISCCVSNLGSGGQDGVGLTLDAQNVLHLTGSAAGTPFDAASTTPMSVAAWNRVALVVDDPQDGVAVNVAVYLNGQPVASLAVPTSVGLPINWNNSSPILLSVLSDATSLNGEIYVSSIQFHSVALKPGMIAGIGSPADGPMLADDPAIVTQPVLSFSQAKGGVSLNWSGNAYVLEETTDLTSGGWVNSALPFTESQGSTGDIMTTAVVTPTPGVPSKFYRLVFRP